MADKSDLFDNQADETTGSSVSAKTDLGKEVAKILREKFSGYDSGVSIGISDSLYLVGKQKFYMGIDYISPLMLSGALYVFDIGLNGNYLNLSEIELLKLIAAPRTGSKIPGDIKGLIEREVIENLSDESLKNLDKYTITKYKLEIVSYLLMLDKILGSNVSE